MDNTRIGGRSSLRIFLLLLIVPRMFGNIAHPGGFLRILITTLNFDFGLDVLAIFILGGPNKIMIRTSPWWCFVLLAGFAGLTTSSKFNIVRASNSGDGGDGRRHRK